MQIASLVIALQTVCTAYSKYVEFVPYSGTTCSKEPCTSKLIQPVLARTQPVVGPTQPVVARTQLAAARIKPGVAVYRSTGRRLNYCLRRNGGCQQTCTSLSRGYRCGCRTGYRLVGKSRCVGLSGYKLYKKRAPVNACYRRNGGCQQTCRALSSGVRCGCRAGYRLLGKSRCVGTPCTGPSCGRAVNSPTCRAGRKVESKWGPFGAWSPCTKTCGEGTQTRKRLCMAGLAHGNPCAAPCLGPATETRACGTAYFHSKWGPYGAWSPCSKSCGQGIQTAKRRCMSGNACGMPCQGPSIKTRACGTAYHHGKWGPYSAWSPCSVTCGQGIQTAKRECMAGNICGAPCVGPNTKTRACGTAYLHSKWGPYGAWSPCSVSCGLGSQSRTRVCLGGNRCGAHCTGPALETRLCGTPIGEVQVLRGCMTGNTCVDRRTECGGWAKVGYCGRSGVTQHCCNSCKGPGRVIAPRVVKYRCVDSNAKGWGCKEYAVAGYCNTPRYKAYMKKSCCRSCNKGVAVRTSSSRLRYSPVTYVQMMNADLKKRRRK